MTAGLLLSACFWLLLAVMLTGVGLLAAGAVLAILGVICMLLGIASLLTELRDEDFS